MLGCPMRKGLENPAPWLVTAVMLAGCAGGNRAADTQRAPHPTHGPAEQAVDVEVPQAEPQGMPGEEQSTIDGAAGAAPLTAEPVHSQRECEHPDQPGCSSCCVKQARRCVVRQSFTDGVDMGGVETWYSAARFLKGECPVGCLPCATCGRREQRQVEHLRARPRRDCDCSVPVGIDPCHSPGSCGCYCSHLTRLKRACPGKL
jgi:hypothetical protein